jgi:hypothetical protein
MGRGRRALQRAAGEGDDAALSRKQELCPTLRRFRACIDSRGPSDRRFHPAAAEVRPVQGAYNVTASAAKGVVYGTGTVAKGVARGTVAVARGVGRGTVCVFTLGSRC